MTTTTAAILGFVLAAVIAAVAMARTRRETRLVQLGVDPKEVVLQGIYRQGDEPYPGTSNDG